MALNINGTTGISGVDGSASAASIAGTDANTGLSFASDTVNINTGGTERMRINSAGSVGIGTSSIDTGYGSSHKLHITSVSDNNWGGSLVLSSADGSSVFSRLVASTSGFDFINTKATSSRFFTNNTERMRIDSAGRFLLGLTSTVGPTEGIFYLKGNTGASGSICVFQSNGNPLSGRDFMRFLNQTGGEAGSIEHSSANAISFLTSSDYRLKENEVLISDGITRLKTLKPYKFNWKSDSSTIVDGFFAHEVSDAVPEAISGTKDQTQDILYTESDTIPSDKKVGDVKETVPDYQQIDQSKLVPLLTAALQEAIAKIETLETKVAALEAG